MHDESDALQAQLFLTLLTAEADALIAAIDTRTGTRFVPSTEELRRLHSELHQIHRYIDRIRERFPNLAQLQNNSGC